MQPVIGITTNQGENVNGLPNVNLLQAYVHAIILAGGIPLLIPSMLADKGWSVVYDRLDGILFSGGGDIGLEYFDGEPHPRVDDVDPLRDSIELSLLRASVEDGKPFLGICRGAQLVNVGLGGTLYTHIAEQLPNALDHAYPGNMRTVLVHEIKLDERARLSEIAGTSILEVNSLHHQGVKEVGPPLKVAGYAPDGLPEALELPGHPFGLAVQWHPEWLTDQKPTLNLFKAFVSAAAK